MLISLLSFQWKLIWWERHENWIRSAKKQVVSLEWQQRFMREYRCLLCRIQNEDLFSVWKRDVHLDLKRIKEEPCFESWRFLWRTWRTWRTGRMKHCYCVASRIAVMSWTRLEKIQFCDEEHLDLPFLLALLEIWASRESGREDSYSLAYPASYRKVYLNRHG